MTTINSRLPYFWAMIYTIIIGLSFLFTKTALQGAIPIDILAFRFTISFMIMSVLVATNMVKINFRNKGLGNIMILSVFYPVLFFVFQAFGLLFATSSEGGIIMASTPIFTLILTTMFLGETTTFQQKLCIGLSVLGVLYIFIMKGGTLSLDNTKGLLLLTLSALAFAIYGVLAQSLSKEFTAVELSYSTLGVGFVFLNIISLSSHVANNTVGDWLTPLANGQFVTSILYLGILSTLVSSALVNYLLSTIKAIKLNVFANLSVVVSIIAGAIVLQEEIYYYHILGSMMIIGGVFGTNLFNKRT